MRKPEDIKIDDKTLAEVIENHKHWLKEDCESWRDMRAYLSGAYLSGADLRGADLSRADLSRADLSGAYLSGAYLSGAYLSGADLRGADLSRAYLSGAYLSRADLSRAELSGAYLSRADLRGADLSGAYLSGAYLSGADLRGADLSGAYLSRADLRGADLSGAKNVPYIPYACPDFGMFIGFKKASSYIVVLEIPEDAKRMSATGRKCRCDRAKVLGIQNIDGTKANITKVASNYDSDFVYEVGKTVSVDNFCDDRWQECSPGIHFFINRQEAVEY